MQHAHYDLDAIERDIRQMFEKAEPDSIHDDLEIVEVFRRAVGVEVEMTKFALSEIMRGTSAEVLFETLIALLTNIIVNRLRQFEQSDDEGNIDMARRFVRDIAFSVMGSVSNGVFSDHSDNAAYISPVMSGRA